MTVTHRPLVFAHRGACRRARENTIEAFAIARELGADGVELDVRRTSDGVLVLHHDAEIDGFGAIGRHTSEELAAVAPWVPTLGAALDELRGLTVNVEIKCLPNEPDHDADGSVTAAVIAMLVERDRCADAVVSSFDLAAIDRVRREEPRLVTGYLQVGVDPSVADAGAAAADHGHRWFHPYWQLLVASGARETIASLRDRDVRTNVWTLDDPAAAVELAAAGVDGVITNVPDEILAAFT